MDKEGAKSAPKTSYNFPGATCISVFPAIAHGIPGQQILRKGQLVALDRTANLLSATASTMLRFKTDQALPAELAARARITGRIAQVKAHDASEVEGILATLRGDDADAFCRVVNEHLQWSIDLARASRSR